LAGPDPDGLAFFGRSPTGTSTNDPDQELAYLVIASTVPAALIGFLLRRLFESAVRSPWVVVFNFVLVGVLFIVGEAVGTRTRRASEARLREALGIGLAQATALVPGSPVRGPRSR
jgi:undecaprenyl-diphosphatase